jgi:hypothetical protein
MALRYLFRGIKHVFASQNVPYCTWRITGNGITATEPFPLCLYEKIQLGGSFNMPHADTHTVLLPHAMAYNAPFVPEAARKIAKALGSQDAAQGLFDLAKSLNAPTSLKELGFEEANIKKAAEIASKTPYPNPAPLLQDKLEKMLNDAYSGTRPAPAPVSQL